MIHYNATVQVDKRPDPHDIDPDAYDDVIDRLPGHSAAIGIAPRGWLEVVITLPADNLAQAANTAVALIAAATGAEAISVEVMPTEEYDKRLGFEPLPELMTVTEAADLLGVSRQAVLDRIRRHTLPASKIGRDYAIPRSALVEP